jgi:hypothetical protein
MVAGIVCWQTCLQRPCVSRWLLIVQYYLGKNTEFEVFSGLHFGFTVGRNTFFPKTGSRCKQHFTDIITEMVQMSAQSLQKMSCQQTCHRHVGDISYRSDNASSRRNCTDCPMSMTTSIHLTAIMTVIYNQTIWQTRPRIIICKCQRLF